MTPEEERDRRGEPVIVYGKKGTIEWGGVAKLASIYYEQGGRIVGVAKHDIEPDPGGERPVWCKVTGSQRVT